MLRIPYFLLWRVVVLLVLGFALAASSPATAAERPQDRIDRAVNEPVFSTSANAASPNPGPVVITSGSFTRVLAARMWNAYTTQGSYTNQIAVDPFSGATAIVHRSNRTGPGSGHLYYTATLDGVDWTDQIGTFTAAIATARHPNMVLTNPTKSDDPTNVRVNMIANTLTPGTWQSIWRVSDAFGAGVPSDTSRVFKAGGLFANQMFVNYANGHVFGHSEDLATSDVDLYRSTNAGASWTTTTVAQGTWFKELNGFYGGDFTPDGSKGIFAFNAIPQPPADTTVPILGYLESTDGGATWSAAPTWVDWRTVPGLAGNVHVMHFYNRAVLDKNGDPHFVGIFYDTTVAGPTWGPNTGIYEVYRSGGAWASKKIHRPVRVTFTNYTIEPDGSNLAYSNEPELARSMGGDTLYVKFNDWPTEADTVTDIYVAGRTLGMAAWTTPVNVTNTPTVRETFTNIATIATPDGRIHLLSTKYGGPAQNSDLLEAELWYHSGKVTLVGVDEDQEIVREFRLSQNYPNPFNPSTRIEYTLPSMSPVRLTVYDILGREVAQLVNEVQMQGSYTIEFNADKLTSGVYVYKLQAGNFVETKKMMLVR